MIGEPVALTVRRHIQRPAPALRDAFRDAPSGFVADACNGLGCMDHTVKPIAPGMRFHGTAVTAFCGPMDNLAAMACLDFIEPGDVIVLAAGGNLASAVVGDLWMVWAKRLGAVAVVTDGLVRDVPGILRVGLPVFARGIVPNSCFKHGPGSINDRVVCAGAVVGPGDILVGDQDGIAVVPCADAPHVVQRLEVVREREAAAEAKIARGERLNFWDEAGLQAAGRIRYVD